MSQFLYIKVKYNTPQAGRFYMKRDRIFCPVCNRERPHTYAYKVRNEYITRKQKFLRFITMGHYKANMYTYCWKCEVCGNRVVRDH